MKALEINRDVLTSCYAREGIVPYLKEMEEEYLAYKRPFSVMIMDVDHFKGFNDKYGHLYGDEVLKYFSSSMRLDLEDERNVPFRFGGDEFVMIFPNQNPWDAYRLAARLQKNIRTRSCLIRGRQVRVSFSGGIAGYPSDASSIEDLLGKADKALYYSKEHGRKRISRYGDLGRQELVQFAFLFLILLIVGGILYRNREPWSNQFNQSVSIITKIDFPKVSAPTKEPHSLLNLLPTEKVTGTAKPATDSSREPEISKIYLESGRLIQGIIKTEDADWIKIEIELQKGTGMMQIKKTQIVRIETGSKTRKF